MGSFVYSIFRCGAFGVITSSTIIVMRKRKLFALLCLTSWGHVTVSVLWFFLTVLWVSLQCVIVVFHDHTLFFQTLINLMFNNVHYTIPNQCTNAIFFRGIFHVIITRLKK